MKYQKCVAQALVDKNQLTLDSALLVLPCPKKRAGKRLLQTCPSHHQPSQSLHFLDCCRKICFIPRKSVRSVKLTETSPGMCRRTSEEDWSSCQYILYILDCPRSGPGPVRALFADPGPGPQVQVQSFWDLDLDLYWTWTWCPVQVRSRSGPGHEYCSVLINNN